jgi:hypothetical protein
MIMNMNRIILPLVLVLLLTSSACSLPSAIPATSSTPELPISTPTTTIPGLSVEMLRNAEYTITGFSDSPRTIKLVDGSFASGPDPAVIDYISIRMGNLVAFGDLDGDSVLDAAVILAINTGGTGVFTYIAAVLNLDGSPVHVASILVDDRPLINTLSIVSSEILAESVVHRADDPMCCPSLPVDQGFRLFNNNMLVITNWAGQTGEGQPRTIIITSPADLTTVSYPFTVSGNVSVGPFENNLAYNIYSADNTLVTSGSVMTDSPNPGDPGNFSLPVDLSMAGVTGLIRIEFIEYGMQDGSILTLESLLVYVP